MAKKPSTIKKTTKSTTSKAAAKPVAAKKVKRTKSKEYLPFSIRFDLYGNAVILNENGEVVKPTRVKFPEESSSLLNIQAISSVQVQNSCETKPTTKRAAGTPVCYSYITCGGVRYKIPIPCPK